VRPCKELTPTTVSARLTLRLYRWQKSEEITDRRFGNNGQALFYEVNSFGLVVCFGVGLMGTLFYAWDARGGKCRAAFRPLDQIQWNTNVNLVPLSVNAVAAVEKREERIGVNYKWNR
jgi:hypothetical protein